MKKKEINAFALRIALAELTIRNSSDKHEVQKAKNEIMTISKNIKSLEDMAEIDERVQEIILEKNKKNLDL